MIQSIVDSKPKLISFNELVATLINKGAKCGCGYKFTKSDFYHYDHGYGVKLADFKNKQWVYARCRRCRYDLALWKIIDSLDFEKKQEEKN
ncbi:MAG: hypothetical protein ACTSRR_09725 [Candidatus Heimdallarchaeaceae archaeon]